MNSKKNVQFGKWYDREKEECEKRIHPIGTPCRDTAIEVKTKKRNMHPCFGYRQTKWLIVDETFCPESIENIEKQVVVVKTKDGGIDVDILENGNLGKYHWDIVKEILFLGGNR